MFRFLIVLLAGLALAACETRERDSQGDADSARAGAAVSGSEQTSGITGPEMAPMSVTGALSYRQSLALPVDAVAHIAIRKARVPEDSPEPLGEQSFALNGRQVPIPFEIELGEDLKPETGPLRMDATISNGAGTVLWETREAATFEFQSGNVDLDIVALSPTPAAVVDVAELSGRDWMVARIDGEPVLNTSTVTLNFSEEGRLSGEASCNAFTGSYTLNEGEMSVAPLALTRKACVPQLMEQEETFIGLLQTVSQVRIDATGKLILQNAEGETLSAR